MILIGSPDQDFPVRDEHLKNFQERLLKGEESTSKLEAISEEEIRIWIIQASSHKLLLEKYLRQNVSKVKEIESQLSNHEVVVCLLEPIEYRIISEKAKEWAIFFKTPAGPI